MDWLIYSGVVAFGATALLIEARRNYRESLTQTPFQRHPILQSAQVSDLCTDRDGFLGFLVYSLLYLVSYGVILSSAELFELVRNADIAKLEVGATSSFDPFGNDVLNLENTSYAKPIFVSTFLIAIMSVGVMRPIENMVRSASHRIAGIPRGVYRVIDALQTHDAAKVYLSRGPGPLTDYFRNRLSSSETEDISIDLSGRREEIEKALLILDALSSAVMPNRRAQFFPVAELEELSKMSNQLETELNEVTRTLLRFDPANAEDLATLHTQAVQTAANTKALFAVHYIRNNQSVKNLDPSTPLARVVDVIDRNYVPEKNSFALAAFLSTCVSAIVIFFIYSTWQTALVNSFPFAASSQIEALIQADLTQNDVPIPEVGVSELVGQCFAGTAQDFAGTEQDYTEKCNEFIAQGTQEYLYEIRPELVVQAIWDTIQMALVAFAAAGAVIFGRDVRLEQESWKPGWSMRRMPFLRLLGLCIVPAIFAFFFSLAGDLTELTFDANFQVTQSQIIQRINDNVAYFAMMPLVGLFVGFGILVIMDKHDDFHRIRTISLLALPCAALVSLLMGVIIFVSYNFPDFVPFPETGWWTLKSRDWLIMSILPALFLILFAWFIELSEEPHEQLAEDEKEMELMAAKRRGIQAFLKKAVRRTEPEARSEDAA